MNDRWGQRIVFWYLAVVPFGVLIVVLGFYGAGGGWIAAMLLYALVYRPILDIFRLLWSKKIDEKDAWKFFVPFYHMKYSKSIWWG